MLNVKPEQFSTVRAHVLGHESAVELAPKHSAEPEKKGTLGIKTGSSPLATPLALHGRLLSHVARRNSLYKVFSDVLWGGGLCFLIGIFYIFLGGLLDLTRLVDLSSSLPV